MHRGRPLGVLDRRLQQSTKPADPALKGAVAFLVSAGPPADKTVRVNIAARESQVEKIDARARRFGLSRSAYLIQAGLGQLDKNSRRRRA